MQSLATSPDGRFVASVGEETEFFIDNLLVRIHFIIVRIRWTGLAPREFEFSFPGSLTSTFPRGTGISWTPRVEWFA